MSSCFPGGGGGRALRLDLDLVKPASPSPSHSSPLRPAHSSPCSTLSEASNFSSSTSSAAAALSVKRPRTPRKRPNQTYNEAAALLAAIYPSVFPTKKTPKTSLPRQFSSLAAFPDADSDLLLPLPVLGDAAFLIREPPPTVPDTVLDPKPPTSVKNCASPGPVSSEFRDVANSPSSPGSVTDSPRNDESGEAGFDDDFDAESILDVEEAAAGADGIDSIMGNLTVDANSGDDSILPSSSINPYLRSLMVFGLAGKFELGLGFRHGRASLSQALKRRDDDGAWWMWPAVPVKDITPTANTAQATPVPAAPAPEKKKSKKKAVKVEKPVKKKRELADAQCQQVTATAVTSAVTAAVTADKAAGKAGLGLKLDHEEVLKAWSDRGPMFADGGGPDSPNSSADVLARLADIDLFPENGTGGGIREASVMRYKEKRRTRLFSKKIRYQVRKLNADCRPRMKGRFVRSPSLLQQALEEES